MSSPKEDDAFESFFEISTDLISKYELTDNYSAVEVGELQINEFSRWTQIKDVGMEFNSSGQAHPKENRVGLYFTGTNPAQLDVFLSVHSLQKLQKETIDDDSPRGNSPKCLFCTNRDSSNKIGWMLDDTYSFHPECARNFREFVLEVFEEHKKELTPYML